VGRTHARGRWRSQVVVGSLPGHVADLAPHHGTRLASRAPAPPRRGGSSARRAASIAAFNEEPSCTAICWSRSTGPTCPSRW
jgi:hypothetical protein